MSSSESALINARIEYLESLADLMAPHILEVIAGMWVESKRRVRAFQQALQAIPQLLPNATERKAARMLADRIMLLDGADSASPSDFAQQIQALLLVQEPQGVPSDPADAADAGTSKAPAKRKPRTRKAT